MLYLFSDLDLPVWYNPQAKLTCSNYVVEFVVGFLFLHSMTNSSVQCNLNYEFKETYFEHCSVQERTCLALKVAFVGCSVVCCMTVASSQTFSEELFQKFTLKIVYGRDFPMFCSRLKHLWATLRNYKIWMN